jgi:E3 ubiquitin-protein ligase DMA1/2
VWHYKCIRPILVDPKQYPHFLCPNCRAVADLNAEVEETGKWDEDFEIIPEGQEDGAGVAEEDSQVEGLTSTLQETELSGNLHNSDTESNHGNSSSPPANNGVPITTNADHESDTLESVVTPRNEAGPFVFDGGRPNGRPMESVTSPIEDVVS